MMNNKGQSLVLFILMIPILVGIMALVIDVGKVYSYKEKQENILEFMIEYGLDDVKDEDRKEKMGALLAFNLEADTYQVRIENDEIYIMTKGQVKGIFSSMLGFLKFDVETEFHGFYQDGKRIVEKVK